MAVACSSTTERQIVAGVTLECSGRQDSRPFYATVGSVEKASGRRIALFTINDPYSRYFNGWSFVAMERSKLAQGCPKRASARALSPNFQERAEDWRRSLHAGRAAAYQITPQQIYVPFRDSDPPMYTGKLLQPGERLWSFGVCTPGRATEGSPDCIYDLHL